MSTFEFENNVHSERLRGTLHVPGATPGDVPTAQADGSLAMAAGGGSQPQVLLAQAVLTNDEILGLPTSGGYELVATPGPDKMIWPQNAVLYCDTNAAVYSGVSSGSELGVGIQIPGDMLGRLVEGTAADVNSLLGYGGLALANCGPYLVFDGNTSSVYPNIFGGNAYADLPLKLYSSNNTGPPDFLPGDFSGGDPANSLAVAVTYSIIDLTS